MQTLTNPKNGETIESPFSNAEALDAIADLDSEFAVSMHTAGTRGNPSPAQAFWIHKLALDTAGLDGIPVPGAFDVIMGYFRTARANGLKWPRLVFDYRAIGGNKLAFGSSRDPNIIVVKFNGKFVGKITDKGFHRRGATDAVVEFAKAIGLGGFEVVRVYGLRTGNCCFCGRELTTGESTAVGYGPICADKYGLPWGETVARSTVDIHKEDACEY